MYFSSQSKWLQVLVDGKSSQEYLVNAGLPQEFILGPWLSLIYINDLPDDVIWDIDFYANDTAVYSMCSMASDLWQQLELTFEFESMWTGAEDRSGLLISILKKSNWFCWCENKWVCSWGKIIFWDAGLTFPSKFDGGLLLNLLFKLAPGKLELWFFLWSSFHLRLLSISINLPYDHAWNTVVTSGLVPLVATWIC